MHLFTLAFLALTIGLLGSYMEDDSVTSDKVTKIADYLYEYTAEGYSTEPPTELKTNNGGVVFGCSAVRNGNFYGRNLDFNINVVNAADIKNFPHEHTKRAHSRLW